MKILTEKIKELEEIEAPELRKIIEKNHYTALIIWMLILGTILGIGIGTVLEDSWYQQHWQPKTETITQK